MIVVTRCQTAVKLCEPNPCQHGGTCQSFNNVRYQCQCRSGYQGDNCELNIGESTCWGICHQWQHWHCFSTWNNTFFWTLLWLCITKLSLTRVPPFSIISTRLILLSHLFLAPLWSIFISYSHLYFYIHIKNRHIKSLCRIRLSHVGRAVADDCASNPCLHGGNCTDLVDAYQCTCPPGRYTGPNCETRISRCSPSLCGPGQCVEDHVHDTFRCICKPGSAYGTQGQSWPLLVCMMYPLYQL